MKVGDYIKPKKVFDGERYISGYVSEYANGTDEYLIQWSDGVASWVSEYVLFTRFTLDNSAKFNILNPVEVSKVLSEVRK